MPFGSSVTTAQIQAVFADEVAARRGDVADTFDDGRRLFTRSVLPDVEEVRKGDRVQGGVALKATDDGVWLFPYVFRLVCRNGAIVAQTLESRSLGDLHALDADVVFQAVREGVEACCAPEVFAENVRKMRTACGAEADLALAMLPMLSRLSAAGNTKLVSQVMDQFFREGDRSRFGVANAVTAVARDTRDPASRWDLEEFGGGIAVGKVPSHPTDGEWGAVARPRQLVSVG